MGVGVSCPVIPRAGWSQINHFRKYPARRRGYFPHRGATSQHSMALDDILMSWVWDTPSG